MRKQLLVFISLLIIIALTTVLFFSNECIAGGAGCDLTITPSPGSVNPGDELELVVRITNITVTQGISGLLGTLRYDTETFELLGYEIISDNWEVADYDETVPSMSVETSSGEGVTTEQDILKIKFRVNTNATADDYDFEIIDAESKPVEAQVTQEFQDPIYTNVTVKNTSNPTNTNTNTNTNTSTNTNINTNTNSNSNNTAVNSNKNADTNTSNTSVPYTGLKVGLGTAVMITLIATIAAGIRYKKYNSIK